MLSIRGKSHKERTPSTIVSIRARKLLLYSGEDWVADFVDGRIALRCARDSLDKTLSHHGEYLHCYDQVPTAVEDETYQLLEHAFVERALGFATVVVFLRTVSKGG